MSGTDRTFTFLALAVASLPLACGHPSAPSAAGCSSDEECSADARCTAHACVANRPPVASFEVTGDLHAGAVVTLDGSASHDPDEGDAVASWAWSLEAVDAPCAGPTVASAQRTAQVRFACAGRYQVRLSVFDGKGAEGTPVARTIDLQAGQGGLVTAGPDQSVGHACTGTPARCTTAIPVQLTAALAAGSTAAFRWSVQPPAGRELDGHRRVRFLPDATAQSPTVEIETDGTAISGDWLFQVEVRDAVGPLDADVTRVSVGNRPPLVQGGPAGAFDHQYVAESTLFTAGGSFPVAVEDPDGDPVGSPQLVFHHTGDGGAAFDGKVLGSTVTFLVSVPRSAPSDALHLAGGAGLARSVEVTAADVNGAAATATFPVLIGNRPPTRTQGAPSSSPHWYDLATQQYLADVDLGRYADPDGDPLDYAVTSDADCPTFAVGASGTVVLRCARFFAGTSSLPGFLLSRSASVTVSDPWAASTSATPAFRIGNLSPTVPATTHSPKVVCEPGMVPTLCPTGGTYRSAGNLFPAATVYAPSVAYDPDGDPMDLSPTSNGLASTCQANQSCTLTVLLPEAQSCDVFPVPPDVRVPFMASDGAATAAGSVLIDPRCL